MSQFTFPDSKTTSLLNETNSYGPLAPMDSHLTTPETLSDLNLTFTASIETELMQTTTSSPSNFLELTTEKLSLTDKSLLSSRLVSESLTSSSTTIVTNNSTNNHSLSNSSSSTHHTKSSSKQRTSSNSLAKSSGGGVRVSGQKIEMPQLNDFFDHSAYLKIHEHGFRWVEYFNWHIIVYRVRSSVLMTSNVFMKSVKMFRIHNQWKFIQLLRWTWFQYLIEANL